MTLRDNPFMIGDEGFYHLKLAKDITNYGSINPDSYDSTIRTAYLEVGLGYLIAWISTLIGTGVENSAKLLFLLLGIGSLLLGYLIIKRLKGKEELLSLFVIVLSPSFIYLFSVVNKFAVPVFLLILSFYIYLKKRKLFFLPLLAMPFFSVDFLIFVVSAIILTLIYFRTKKILFFLLIFPISVLIFIFGDHKFSIISDFGAEIGVSIFAVISLFFGIVTYIKDKRLIQLYAITFLLFILSFKFLFAVFILTIPLSLLVAINLTNLLNMKWESTLIRDLTVLILICGLLFSSISYSKYLSEKEPSEDLFDALSNLPRGSVVLSHESNSNWINYAGMKVVEGGDLVDLFKTRNLDNVMRILDKYDVDYILITPSMKHGLVWSVEEEGLLFLLKYDERFVKVYEEIIEVWEYKPKQKNI